MTLYFLSLFYCYLNVNFLKFALNSDINNFSTMYDFRFLKFTLMIINYLSTNLELERIFNIQVT